MVHKVPSPRDSTNRAMIASISGSGDPARISFKMLSTASLEKSANSSNSSIVPRVNGGDCIVASIRFSLLSVTPHQENVPLARRVKYLHIVSDGTMTLVNV